MSINRINQSPTFTPGVQKTTKAPEATPAAPVAKPEAPAKEQTELDFNVEANVTGETVEEDVDALGALEDIDVDAIAGGLDDVSMAEDVVKSGDGVVEPTRPAPPDSGRIQWSEFDSGAESSMADKLNNRIEAYENDLTFQRELTNDEKMTMAVMFAIQEVDTGGTIKVSDLGDLVGGVENLTRAYNLQNVGNSLDSKDLTALYEQLKDIAPIPNRHKGLNTNAYHHDLNQLNSEVDKSTSKAFVGYLKVTSHPEGASYVSSVRTKINTSLSPGMTKDQIAAAVVDAVKQTKEEFLATGKPEQAQLVNMLDGSEAFTAADHYMVRGELEELQNNGFAFPGGVMTHIDPDTLKGI